MKMGGYIPVYLKEVW